MKKLIVVLAVALLAAQMTQAQGTTYLSNLGQSSTGSAAVGSDSWLAAPFETGNDASGYLLNSIQLGMTDASGNPSNFTVMVYSAVIGGAVLPGTSLDTLNGSLNPVTAGTYTYNASSSLTLSANTPYFIVLTAGTAVANGAYELSDSTYPPSSSSGWRGDNGVLNSSDGISGWSPTPYLGIAQFAINATTVPEPSPSFLLLLGSGVFIYVRRAFRR
jgi:hypothetical protein